MRRDEQTCLVGCEQLFFAASVFYGFKRNHWFICFHCELLKYEAVKVELCGALVVFLNFSCIFYYPEKTVKDLTNMLGLHLEPYCVWPSLWFEL